MHRRMEMTNRSKSGTVISVSFVYFSITSVHPPGNLSSREWSVAGFPALRGSGFISEAMMNSQQTPTRYRPWMSMHLNEASLPSRRTTQGFLNSLLSSTTSNTLTTAVAFPSFPPDLFFKSFSLTFLFFGPPEKGLSSAFHNGLMIYIFKKCLLLLPIKPQSVIKRRPQPHHLSALDFQAEGWGE